MNPRDQIITKQIKWAISKGLQLIGSHGDREREAYTMTVEDNLFLKMLNKQTRKNLDNGNGGELAGTKNKPAKIKALHSSAALACNFFDHWRDGNLAVLNTVFSIPAPQTRLAFERKFPTGLNGIAPNVDVVFEPGGTVFAIESKFTEPYSKSKLKCFLKPKYFLNDRHLWTEVGLPKCQVVAEKLLNGTLRFEFLDVTQLLKHMLGLGHTLECTGSRWRLCYLWYRVHGNIGDLHQKELDLFCQEIEDDAGRFISMTYQELFHRIKSSIESGHEAWVSYMEERYFDDATA